MSAVAAVAAVAASGAVAVAGAAVAGAAMWVRAGRAERRVDAKAVVVLAEVAALPHTSLVLPPDRARNRAVLEPGFTGYQVWRYEAPEGDTVELAIVKRTLAAIEAGGAS